MVKRKPRSDPFYLGMKNSIQAFYGDLAAGRGSCIDLEFGAHLVDVCERIAQSFKPLPAPTA